MKLSIAKKLALGFGILLSLQIVLGVFFMTTLSNAIQQFKFVIEHDAPVIASARELSKLVVDMETGQRGFPYNW